MGRDEMGMDENVLGNSHVPDSGGILFPSSGEFKGNQHVQGPLYHLEPVLHTVVMSTEH